MDRPYPNHRTAPTTLPDYVPRWRLDVRAYHRMGEAGILGRGDRVELIEGELVAMSPQGGRHVSRVMHLAQLLTLATHGRAILTVQMPIQLGEHSEPEPDIAVVRPSAKRYVENLPRPADTFLVIEVADTTLRYDLSEKALLYARHGIAEYWVVDVVSDALIVHHQPSAGGYTAVRRAATDEVLEPVLLPGLRLAVADILA